MRARFAAGSLALALLGAGCTALAIRGADPAALQSGTLIDACPLGVRGTRASVVDVPEGIAVTFVTQPPNVDELRLRVRDQARVNGPDRRRGRGHFGEHQGPRTHGLRLWTVGPLGTSVEDVSRGARLTVRAEPADVVAIRRAIVERVARIESAGCF
jgi:hypothetical protein